jgi:serine/threonine protein phosphatase PrpC
MIPLLHATETRTGATHRGGNEDRHVAVVDAFPGPAFAVFDGHGGAAASAYLSDPSRLVAVVDAQLRRTIGEDLVDAMARLCRDIQNNETKHKQTTTEIKPNETQRDGASAGDHAHECLDEPERLLVRDRLAYVGRMDEQEVLSRFWGLVDQSFPSVITRAFHHVDETLLQAIHPKPDGATAIVVWLVGHSVEAAPRLYCANVGDSRAVLCRGGAAIALSHDHKLSDPHERARVERNGGLIRTTPGTGVKRVYSLAAAQLLPQGTPVKCLAMARSFGDRQLKHPAQCVTCEPDVRTVRLGQDDLLFIVASDGVWGALTNQEAVEIALAHFGDAEAAAQAIVWEAQQRGSKDDVTATVVQFGWQGQRAREVQQTLHSRQPPRQAQKATIFARV